MTLRSQVIECADELRGHIGTTFSVCCSESPSDTYSPGNCSACSTGGSTTEVTHEVIKHYIVNQTELHVYGAFPRDFEGRAPEVKLCIDPGKRWAVRQTFISELSAQGTATGSEGIPSYHCISNVLWFHVLRSRTATNFAFPSCVDDIGEVSCNHLVRHFHHGMMLAEQLYCR